MPGIVGTVSLAATLALAAPLALFGLQFLLDGDPLGAPFVALAVLMVVLQQWLTTPQDLPALVAERTVGAIAEDEEE